MADTARILLSRDELLALLPEHSGNPSLVAAAHNQMRNALANFDAVSGQPVYAVDLTEGEIERLVMLCEMVIVDTPEGVQSVERQPDQLADKLSRAKTGGQ